MAEDTRRGFLKTLGKLGAAVGLTAAVASTSGEAKIPTTPKANEGGILDLKPRSDGATKLASNSHTTQRPKGAFEFGFTGFKTDPMAADKIEQLNRDANLLYNQVIDNKHMEINPPMVVPQHVYDYITKRHVMDELDPFQWGNVFDLKWVDWHSTDARFATKRAYWEARVRRPYRGIFREEMYRKAVELPMEYLYHRVDQVDHADRIMSHVKSRSYDELVRSLQDAIETVIATDKRMNPKTTAPNRNISWMTDEQMKSITK